MRSDQIAFLPEPINHIFSFISRIYSNFTSIFREVKMRLIRLALLGGGVNYLSHF